MGVVEKKSQYNGAKKKCSVLWTVWWAMAQTESNVFSNVFSKRSTAGSSRVSQHEDGVTSVYPRYAINYTHFNTKLWLILANKHRHSLDKAVDSKPSCSSLPCGLNISIASTAFSVLVHHESSVWFDKKVSKELTDRLALAQRVFEHVPLTDSGADIQNLFYNVTLFSTVCH